ncbi:hypothetical protein [Borrelia sp. RT1S]|uniref:hypothetical protein n=1 Tax=Borrelia sp. RT1S TaxID=2898580 RepID=UPI001E342F23|nr:hypothetical protein [Borrelia sp. RT1S]UGQ17071.1 hypothetical protein LSO05_01360 [Borrelia sp. RT1S]
MFGREIRYVLLFSTAAFVVSVIFGLLARVYFFTILFRAFVQFVFFFFIGILIEFIYKKYLCDLFKDALVSSKGNDDHDKGEKYETGVIEMSSLSNSVPVDEKRESVSDFLDEKRESGGDFQFVEEIEKYNVEHSNNRPSGNIKFSDKLSSQLSYLEANDPKIVAKAIKTLINRKE